MTDIGGASYRRGDEKDRIRAELGRFLSERRLEANMKPIDLAKELILRDGSATKSTWSKRITNAENVIGKPRPAHLQWCAERGSPDELVRLVRAASLASKWDDLHYWTPKPLNNVPMPGFTGFRQILDGAGFSLYDISAVPTDVLWMHRLRRPHLIHGVFCLAAIAALRAGASVHLLIDDTPPEGDGPNVLYKDLVSAVDHWLAGAGFSVNDLEIRRYTEVIASADGRVDLWTLQHRYLESMSVVQYLRSAKLVPNAPVPAADDPVIVRTEAKAVRLLATVYNFAVLEIEAERLLAAESERSFVTLGGQDEQLMWDRWRYSNHPGDLQDKVGHIYLARMPVPKPPWEYAPLDWRSRGIKKRLGEVLAAASDVGQPSEAVADLVEWLHRAAIVLPSELQLPDLVDFGERSGLYTVSEVRAAARSDMHVLAKLLGEGISSWFY